MSLRLENESAVSSSGLSSLVPLVVFKETVSIFQKRGFQGNVELIAETDSHVKSELIVLSSFIINQGMQ